MKKVSMAAAAFVLSSLFATAAMAKDVNLQGCTKDGKTATVKAVINDEALAANPAIEQSIQKAFADTAFSMTADDLVTDDGAKAFLDKLSKPEVDAVSIDEPPAISRRGRCAIRPQSGI
jgi:hypothetical protein